MEQYNVTGMTCAACSARVEKAVKSVEGVTECAVSLLTNSMGVSGSASPQAIIAAVEKAGYRASLKNGEAGTAQQSSDSITADKAEQLLKRRLAASLVFLMVLMYFSMGHNMLGAPVPGFMEGNPIAIGLMQLLLSAIIMVINQRFFISGFKGLIHRAPNMDTLVALGSAAAFVYSTCVLFGMTSHTAAGTSHDFYFESAGMILTLITVGKMLEARSKGRTTDALKSLMDLAPKTATVIRGESETIVLVNQVRRDDIFVVRPGESIPVDGIVLEGETAVNESALTGESIPVDKTAGDEVSAATINTSGFIRCRALRVGEDTALSKIIKMVTDATATKAPIAKIADKVSGIFVPVVISVAAVTFVVWMCVGRTIGYSLARAISVLVISCPCALGLATPVAIMVGSGVGAKHGVLYKTAAALENTGRSEIVVLDKTGTVTTGEPVVTDIIPAAGIDEDELLLKAAGLENRSEHPLSRAVMAYVHAKNMSIPETESFRALPGNGLTAKMSGKTLSGGNLRFISGIADIPPAIAEQSRKLAEAGKTPLFFAEENHLIGVIAVADKMKDDSPEAIRQLREMGIRVVMLTGDNERTANAIAKRAGIDEVIAGVLPEGKAQMVRRLKQQGKVAMVGDGINDAPALTEADMGIAIGAGTDVAIDAADVVLMKSRLTDVPAAIRLSRQTLRNIRQNLFWAFFYNAIGIPLAAGVWIPVFGWQLNPMFGAAAMSLSSFCVITNALRLNLFDMMSHKRDRKINHIHKEIKEEKNMTKTMKIQGMMCGHCEAHVKKALEAIEGVQSAVASHTAGTAVVTLSAPVADDVLRQAVEAQDYKVLGIE